MQRWNIGESTRELHLLRERVKETGEEMNIVMVNFSERCGGFHWSWHCSTK